MTTQVPHDVQYPKKASLLIWRPRGILDQEQVDRIIGLLTEQENKFGKAFDRFTDLSAVDAVDLTFDYVFQVALYRRLSRQGRDPVKSAFFVPNKAVAHYVRLHAVLTDRSPLEVALFDQREAAAEWLGVGLELIEFGG